MLAYRDHAHREPVTLARRGRLWDIGTEDLAKEEAMADEIRRVDYYPVMITHRAGEGAKLFGTFKKAKVDFFAIHAFPEGRKAQVDFVPEDPATFEKAAKASGIKLGRKKSAFLIRGRDRIGALADALGKLGNTKVNVTAVDAMSTGGNYGVLLWVRPNKVDVAAKALGAK